MENFDLVFIMHLTIELLSMTNFSSCVLERRDDQDIVKDGLQDMRDNKWEPLLKK